MFEELPHELKVPEEFTPENSSAESSPEKGPLHIEAPAPTDLKLPLAILEEAKRVEETTSEEGCEHERPGNQLTSGPEDEREESEFPSN